MPLPVRKIFLSAALAILKGFTAAIDALGRLSRSGVFAPARFVGRIVFRTTMLPLYRLQLLVQRAVQRTFLPAKNPVTFTLTHRYVIHTLVVVLALLVVYDNVTAEATRADQSLEQNSAIAQLAPAQEGSEETTEGPLPPRAPLAAFGLATVTDEGTRGQIAPVESTSTALAAGGAILPEEGAPGEGAIRQSIETYVVEGGDTVSTIARKFGISTETVLAANGLSDSDFIKPGQQLRILPVSGVAHEVKSGETLDAIVKRFSGNVDAVIEFNRLASASDIHSGDVLVIPGGSVPEAPRPQVTPRSGLAFQPFNIPPSAKAGGGGWLWPTPQRKINQYFRYRHTGIDIEGSYSSPIYASANGTVEYVSYQRYGYGYHVIINHGGGRETLYGHASKIFVKPGQTVTKGQTIAIIGSTGRSTGTHLHFEIILNGVKVNPLSYL